MEVARFSWPMPLFIVRVEAPSIMSILQDTHKHPCYLDPLLVMNVDDISSICTGLGFE